MTVAEIIEEVYENLGEPTNLNPYTGAGALDPNSSGYQSILRWINMGIRAVATWKDRQTGRVFRYLPFSRDVFVQPRFYTIGIIATSTTDTLYTNNVVLGLEGSVLLYGSDVRRIVYSDVSGVIRLGAPLTTAPTVGQTVEVREAFLRIPSSRDFVDVLKVVDESTGEELEKGERGEFFYTTRGEVGVPSEWQRGGDRVYLNYTPMEQRWYRLVCYVLPDEVEVETEEPAIPPQFHRGVVIYATALGFARMQEMAAKYSTMQDFEQFMRTTQTQEDIQGRLDNGIQWIMEAR